MPSPVESTVPVSETSTCLPYPLICSRRIRLISSARISICATPFQKTLDRRGLEPIAHALELAAQAAVVLGGADLGDDAADQRGIGPGVEDDVAPGHLFHRALQALQFAIGERSGRGDGGADPANLRVGKVAIDPGDQSEIGDPLPIDQEMQAIRRSRRDRERYDYRAGRAGTGCRREPLFR